MWILLLVLYCQEKSFYQKFEETYSKESIKEMILLGQKLKMFWMLLGKWDLEKLYPISSDLF